MKISPDARLATFLWRHRVEVISGAQKTGAQRRNEVRTTQLITTLFTNRTAILLALHKSFGARSCRSHVARSFRQS